MKVDLSLANNVLTPLAKSILVALELTAAVLAADAGTRQTRPQSNFKK